MRLYDFDSDERMIQLTDNLNYVTIIKNSMADSRSEYRRFANELSIDYIALQSCCDTYERNLLIDIYTYAEQLIKNFYYHVMEKDSIGNLYVRNFINKKLDPEKFSPNAKYIEIEKGIRQELIPEFKFTFSEQKNEIAIYNELIKSRHIYAHRGQYTFVSEYSTVIEVVKYIAAELEMVVNNDISFRMSYQFRLKEVQERSKELMRMIDNYNNSKSIDLKRSIITRLKEYRNSCRIFINMYGTYLIKSTLLATVKIKLEQVANCDLRKSRDAFGYISELNAALVDVSKIR